MDFIVFLRASPQRAGAAFQKWYAEEYAPGLKGRLAGLRRHVVNFAHEGPEELRLSYDIRDPLARYDVVTEMSWLGPGCREALGRIDAELAAWADVRHVYRVSSTVILDDERETAGPRPGIKLFRELLFYHDMSDEAVKRCWMHHANLAVKVHTGATRYVQHWVEERLSQPSPQTRGIVEFYFPSTKELVERYYESQAGKEAVMHDTGHFIEGRLPRAYAQEIAILT